MIEVILLPLQDEFMRTALIMAVILGIICPVAGSYLIVQKMGFLGEVIAHSVLPGLAIYLHSQINIFIGDFISGTLSSLIITWIDTQSKVKTDVAMSIVFSAFLALGIMLITLLKSKLDLHSILFGDILGITHQDLYQTIVIALCVLLFIKLFYKELLFYTFNPLGAKAVGLPVDWLRIGLICMITLTIIASMQAVGVVLVVSLLISPGITAYLLVKELDQMMFIGAIFGVISSVMGMYLSYYFNLPSGPAIVLVSTGFFIVSLLFSPSQGMVTQKFLDKSLLK